MIDREKVIKGLNDIHAVACGLGDDECYLNSIGIKQLQTLIDDATELLKAQPAVDAVPVVHAKWQEKDGGKVMECSACHVPMAKTRVQWGEDGERYIHILTNYCSYCGAKMDKEE